MTPHSLGRYRSASLAALLVLLPVNGYVWSLPVSNAMLTLAGILLVLGLGALFLVIYFSAASDREMARLADDVEKKSAQVLALAEAAREDDRIIEGLTDRMNQLKSTLLHHEIRHIEGAPEIVFPDAAPPESGGGPRISTAPSLTSHPKLYSVQDFQTLATQFARVAVRYERKFTAIRIRMNLAERERAVGPEKAAEEYRVAIEVISNTLRTSGFAATDGSDSIIIGYPETSVTHVEAIMTRLRAALKASAACDLAIELDRKVQDEKSVEA